MKTEKRLYSIALALTALVLLLILISSSALASTLQCDSPTRTYAYIANPSSNNVSVIDTATNTIISTVDVGQFPLGIAVTPDGKKVYVANSNSNNISVIDAATKTVTVTINAGNTPRGVAVTPNGKKVYVANYGSNNVSVIDTATNNVTVTLNVGKCPFGVAVTPNGTKVYVANSNSNNVSVIDTATNTVTSTGDVGQFPFGVAVTPDGAKVYVTNFGSNNVSVIDAATKNVTATVNAGGYPYGVAVTPDGTKVYVTNYGSNNVSVIDTATNKATYTVNVGSINVAFGKFISTLQVTGTVTEPVLPIANFSTNVTSGSTPLSVQFTDLSKNTTGWNWNFGDGANSTQRNPMHTYSTASNYTVVLTVSNVNGTDAKSSYITVSDGVNVPDAAFTASQTLGNAPLNVSFNDKSTGSPTSWIWYFGDGTNSTLQNPVYKFSKSGLYSVALTASNAAGSSSVTKFSYITVSNGVNAPDAAFTASQTSGNAPLNVSFNDKSTGSPTSWKWYFGDSTNSTQQNPVHTFSKLGLYTVTLSASNAGGSSSVTKSIYITVSNGVNAPVAAFSAVPTSGSAPLSVSFTDKSTGSPTSLQWYFGDSTNSTQKNPVHIYSKAGKYTASLTVNNPGGSSTKTMSAYVTVK
jgi:YVTN family beta-propeller protein